MDLLADLRAQLAAKAAENERLLAEVARLREDLGRLHGEMAALREQGVAANARIDELVQQVARASDRIGELLAIAQRKKRGAPSPPPAPPPPPAVPEEQQQAFADRPTPPGPPAPVLDHPRQKHRPTGRRPLPDHLPVDETTTSPSCCARCQGTNLETVDEVVEEKLDVVAHQRIRRTRRKTCRCKDCGARTTGEAPPAPFPRSKVTCGWLAWLVVQKFHLVVPLDRVRRYLGVQGITLAMSFLVSQIERAADLLAAIDGEHWKQLLGGTHLATDGTGFEVQIRGVGLHHGFLEVYHWGDVAVVQYEAEKGGQTQASKLGRFGGTLLVDAESRYNESFRSGEIIEANCNAHGRRKFRDAETAQPVLAAEAGQFLGAMFGFEADAQKAGLTGAALLAWRREHIAPVVERFRRWMDAVEPTLTPSDPVARTIRYYRNHWDGLTRFLHDPDLPLDNSASEREFQHVAKIRLNCLFAGGTEGAHRAAVLLGIMATCRRVGIDPQAYLTWVFERVGTHAERYGLSAAELTPAAYKAAHPAAAAG